MSYIIGSFNLRDFNFSTEIGHRSFDKIASIIINEKMDIVAVQEVNSKQAIEELVKYLNRKSFLGHWNYRISQGSSGHSKDSEELAFIWNEKRLSLVDILNKENPRLIKNFKIDKKAGQRDFARYPYFARFTPINHIGGTFCEIRVLNTHIRYSKDDKLDLSEKQMRLNEFNVLVKRILPSCECVRSGNNMPQYTFLTGDYNLCLNEGPRVLYKIKEITESSFYLKAGQYKTVQDKPTSLKKPPSINVANVLEKKDEQPSIKEEDAESIYRGEYYKSNYDHFTYNTELENKLKLNCSRVDPIDKMYCTEKDRVNRMTLYWKEISDHVPIKMEVNIKTKEVIEWKTTQLFQKILIR